MKSQFLIVAIIAFVTLGVSAHHVLDKTDSAYSAAIALLFESDTTKVTDAKVDSVAEWRQWKTVQNFAYGKDRGSLPMIADLQSLHPYFRDRVLQLIKNCRAKGIELAIVESYRTHIKQSEYFSMGKKYTRSAGGKSKHQYGLAVDVVPVKDSLAIWDNATLWKKIGAEGEKLGLRWGGRWKSPYDPAHFEWSGGITAYQLAQGMLPAIPKTDLELYPCVDEDLQQLKKYWEAWEGEQALMVKEIKDASLSTTKINTASSN